MKLFLDSADLEEVREALASKVLDGVTTNPTLLRQAREKHGFQDVHKYLKELFKLVNGLEVSLEVCGTSYEEVKREALRLHKLFKKENLLVKVPVNLAVEEVSPFQGLRVVKELAGQGLRVNVTLVMTPEQAVLAAKAGAAYVSPFVGRIDDYIREKVLGLRLGKDFDKESYFPAEGYSDEEGDNGVASGVDLAAQIVQAFSNHGFKAKVLAASVRNARQARELMLVGVDALTLPLKVFKDLLFHEKTVEGVKRFAEDSFEEYKELLSERRKFSISIKKE